MINAAMHKGMDLQAAHLPRKAPKDTLPMPVANIQKQNKCSRNSECSAVGSKSTELKPELQRATWVPGRVTSKST